MGGDENPLIQAAAAGHADIVDFLLDRGADVNVRVRVNGFEIRTALNQAQRFGHAEIAGKLEAHGAK